MATVIRLQRGGRKKRPFYSVVVMDKRNRRDGAFIEKLGYYDPCTEPEILQLDLERVNAWKAEGAELSARVTSLVRLAENPELAAKAQAKADQKAADKKAAVEAKAKAEAAEAEAAAKAAEKEKKAEEAAAAKAAAEEQAASEAAAAEAETAEAETTEEAPVEEAVADETAAEEKKDA